MSEEEIREAMDYNLEYMEAMSSEEIFGGDYTSAVDLKYANKEIEQLHQEIQQLKEDIEDYDRIFDIWNKRTLINKFNKEYSKKVVKEERAKGNKIVGAIPDAEYVYKKYYEQKQKLDLYKSVIDEVREYIKENDLFHFGYDEEEMFEVIVNHKEDILEILDKANKKESE